MNSIMAIHPYKHEGMWVFDDENAELVKEPFVSGADTAIDKMVVDIPDAEFGFTMIFAGTPFPGYQHEFEWSREEFGGNWYRSNELDQEGWLCPAMFKYFDEAPPKLYVQCKPKGG